MVTREGTLIPLRVALGHERGVRSRNHFEVVVVEIQQVRSFCQTKVLFGSVFFSDHFFPLVKLLKCSFSARSSRSF